MQKSLSSSQEYSEYQHHTESLYASLHAEGEQDALAILARNLKHQSTSSEKRDDDYARDTKETIIIRWRQEHPIAGRLLDKICAEHSGIAHTLAYNAKAKWPHLDVDDLLMVATRELQFCVPLYDENVRNNFVSFASTNIKNALHAFSLCSESRRRLKETRFVRLDEEMRTDDGVLSSRHERMENKKAKTPECCMMLDEDARLLELIKVACKNPSLDARLRKVLRLRHTALSGKKSLPLREVGVELGVSRQRAGKLEEDAIEKVTEYVVRMLQAIAKGQYIHPFDR